MLLAFFFACFCALGLLGAAAVPLERRQYWFGETGVYDAINCVNPRHLALTFDDGPSSFTPTLLNYLRQKNVKATFFVVGSQVDALPQILVQAFNEGHQIASHTYSHPSLPSLGSAAILSELQRTEQAIVSRIGVAPVYMRPPYGDVDQRTGTVIRSFGEKITVWSFDSNDWRYTGDSQAVIDSFASLPPPSSGPGVIALAHDIHSWTVEAMPAVIDLLRGKGYQLVTLSECLGGAAAYKGVTSTITTSVAATSTRPTTTTTASPGGSCPSGCGTGVYWATGKCINSVCRAPGKHHVAVELDRDAADHEHDPGNEVAHDVSDHQSHSKHDVDLPHLNCLPDYDHPDDDQAFDNPFTHEHIHQHRLAVGLRSPLRSWGVLGHGQSQALLDRREPSSANQPK
ncbi:hypothetical protein DFJ74DRAFT_712712 [Hyaloraphidium curvatum]|nr:hypothetical protein DFJ74DRAFT_712712 [Hyaloraphidium curvatum]